MAELLAGNAALIPFVPYARDASEAGVAEAIAAADRVTPRALRAELLGALAVFAENVFKDVDWAARMPRELLMESRVYKLGEAEGRAEGARSMVRLQLEAKLGADAARFVDRLGACTTDQLEALGRLLVGDRSRDELILALEQVLLEETPHA